jgi:hypothetical protein
MNPRYLALLDLYAGRDQAVLIISAFVFGLTWTWHTLSTSQLVATQRGRVITAYWLFNTVLYTAALIGALLWKG